MPRLSHRSPVTLTVVALFFAGFALLVSRQPSASASPSGPASLEPLRDEWARTQLAEMTLEQKIAQLFSVRAYSYYTSRDDEAHRRLLDFVERFEIGGLTFFQGEPLEQATLANEMQRHARLPLLIAQDMEWGAGMRVEHTTTFPRTMALGAARDPELAYAVGYVTAREARALGTHQVFAPVADVNNNPANPIINVRSFGEDPQLVAEMATAFARGVQDGGAIATAKHFPGHGDTDTDSHADLPVLPIDRDRLARVELVPFRALIDEGVRSVMTGHLAFPEVEPDPNVPATLSPRVTTAILREELGFDGLVVTDALDMAGVTKHFGTGEAAVRALEAGADMLLLSEDPYAARSAIVRAVDEGRLTEARLDASVLRVLQAKAWLGLAENRFVDVDAVRDHVGTNTHHAVAETVARRSLTLLRNEGDLVPFFDSARRILCVTLSDSDAPDVGTFFAEQLRRRNERGRVTGLRVDVRSDTAAYEQVRAQLAKHDVVVVPTFLVVRAWSGRINLAPRHRALLDALVSGDAPVVLVSFGNPYVPLGLAERPDVYIAAYGSSEASQRAVADALYGRGGFHGRLPVSIPGLYAFGAGLELEQAAVRTGYPAEAGMDDAALQRVDSLMYAAIEDRAFPGGAVAVGRHGVLARLRGYGYYTYGGEQPVTPQSVFDLASLTKVVATTTATMKLYDEGRLKLDEPVATYLPAFGQNGKESVTVAQLLSHSAGLIPYRAFHRMGLTSRRQVIDTIMGEELQYEPGTESRYSDFGLITMMLVVEEITGRPFSDYVAEEIFEPLGMYDTGFRPTGRADAAVVPTEYDRDFRGRLIQGEVHDETAWILGGTSGHAGLFSTAEDLSRFAHMLLNEGRAGGQAFVSPATVRRFTAPVDPDVSTRALGWDTKDPDPEKETSAGRFFGPRSFGHTGFTGTSLWIDPDQELFVILLANRVYPTRQNMRIGEVRPALADLAYQAILGRPGFTFPLLR